MNASNAETTFSVLSTALDDLADEKRLKFLIKLAMVLSDRVRSPDVLREAVSIARKNL